MNADGLVKSPYFSEDYDPKELLAKLLGPIILRREGGRLVAEMKGNLPALLEMGGEALYNPGSGGRI